MLSSYLYLGLFYSWSHAGVLASSPSSCEELCKDQDYGTVFSMGCCKNQYCRCSNDADNFMESCPVGTVFCLDRCVSIMGCALTDNCCQVHLESTTTTSLITTPTTTSSPNDCDRLCVGHNEEFVSEYCCSHNYCFCSSVSGNVEYRCPSQEPFFCESEQRCCSSCGPCPTTTTSSPSTSPTPSPGHTCSELCLTAGDEELVGECCGEEFCLCSSSGVYEVRCPAGQLYCPLLQDCLHSTSCLSHQEECCALTTILV